MVEVKQIVGVSVGAAALSVVGYAVYFDYQRRHNPAFRRSLRELTSSPPSAKLTPAAPVRESKRQERQAAQQAAKTRAQTAEQLKAAILEIQREPAPDQANQEQYFMEQLSIAEQLASRGPAAHVEAAKHFYKALKVYPVPTELIAIYEKTQPVELFSLIMAL
jgi:import receptor subunit TOM20